MKKIKLITCGLLLLFMFSSCDFSGSNEKGRYFLESIGDSDTDYFVVFDTQDGTIYTGGKNHDQTFYLTSRNAITGEEKLIIKPKLSEIREAEPIQDAAAEAAAPTTY